MEIDEREKDGVMVLDLKGQLRIGEADLALREAVKKQVAAGKVNLVLNLDGVTEIDHTGVGTLTAFDEELLKAGGRLALLNLPQTELEMTTVKVYTDEQAAVDSFFPNRALPEYDILQFVEEQELVKPKPE